MHVFQVSVIFKPKKKKILSNREQMIGYQFYFSLYVSRQFFIEFLQFDKETNAQNSQRESHTEHIPTTHDHFDNLL